MCVDVTGCFTFIISFSIGQRKINHVEGISRKLLLCEDILLSAQFWELCLRLIYVEAAVLRSDLENAEKVEFIQKFNNSKNKLIVL